MDNNNSNNHEDNNNINGNDNDNDNDNHDRDNTHNTHEDEAAMKIGTLTDDQLGSQEDDEVTASIVSVVDEEGRTNNNTSKHSDVTAEDGHKMVGEKVNTMYGIGVVLGYRKTDGIFEIQILNNGGQASGKDTTNSSSSRSLAILFTSQSPTLYRSPTEIANKLNVAYQALEKMRRLNLEIQCHEIGIHSDKIDYDMCTHCMITNGGSESQSHFPRIQRLMDSTNTATNDFDMQEKFPRLHNFFNYSSSSVSADNNDNGGNNNQLPPSTTATATTTTNGTDLAIQFPRINNFFNNSSSSVPAGTVNASNGRMDNDDSIENISQPLITTNNGRTDLATAVENSASQQTAPTPTTIETTTPPEVIPFTTYFDRTKIDPTSIPGGENPSAETTTPVSITTALPIEAAAASASNLPPSQTNGPDSSASFPRMRNLWSTIQSIPQPGVAQPSAAASSRDLINRTNASLALTAPAATNMTTTTTTTVASPAPTSSTSFPRIRGLLNSSVSSSIFGDSQISNNNRPADRGIMNSGISGNQTSYTSSSNSASIRSVKPIALPRIQKLIDQRTKANTHPCLICASPSCSSHSSASFRKEGITLCLHCERLFELDFIVGCVSAPDATLRAERIDYMIDCYDRCILLLQYSTQFVDKIAECLEDQKEQQNKIGLASSSVGVLSGVLGIAAAASILTPAGPPLLIASLFFGGSASTVQTGTEAMNYFSEPRKLSDRIIALHGMSLSILRVTSTLRDAMLRDHIRPQVYEVDETSIQTQMKDSLQKNKTAVIAGSNLGRSITLGGLAGAEVGAASAVVAGAAATEVTVVGGSVAAGASAAAGASVTGTTAAAGAGAAGARSATALSRAGTAAARTVRFARFAGGALSAAVLVMEANAIQSTLRSMNEGSPCDKADTLRRVKIEIGDFPSTNELDDECQAYLAALASHPPQPPTAEVSALSEDSNINQLPEATCQEFATGQDLQLCAPGTLILDRVDDLGTPTTEGRPPAAVPVSNSSFLGGSSLIQRIRSRQEERRILAASTAEDVIAVAMEDGQPGESNYNLVL